MFLAFGKWLIFTRAGRALIGTLALAAALWWAYSTVWQRGYDVADAEAKAAHATLMAQMEAERARFEREARQKEADQRAALHAVAEQYEQEKIDAQERADRTIADLRDGTVRLRNHWQGCIATASLSGAAASAAVADDGAELREQGARDLVHVGESADAQVRGLQAALNACTGAQ
jgi:hypothetical protein